MIIKNKSTLLLILTAGVFLLSSVLITGCATTPESSVIDTDTGAVTKENKEVKEKPSKKEPDDPPNVKFVKQLQALLEKGDTEGAIAHFSSIPASLKNDLELKNLLGALYYSAAQYDNAIATAEEILVIDPENMSALELISMCTKAKGDTKAYKAASERILAADP